MHADSWIGSDLALDNTMATNPVAAGSVDLFVDLETLPAGDPPKPEEIKAPANYKDPVKILAYQQEKVDEVFRARALDPLQGEICSIAWALNDRAVQSITRGIEVETEKALLEKFQAAIIEATGAGQFEPVWIGHNVLFDLGWIWKRSFRYGGSTAAIRAMVPREKWSKQIIDTQRLWQFDRELTSLGELARFLGLDGNTGKGSEVFDLFQAGEFQALKEYNEADVEITRKVFWLLTGGNGHA